MGDIIKLIKVKSERDVDLNLYFDSGSPFTFVGIEAANRLGGMHKLSTPVPFSGIGDRQFSATHIIHIEVKLLDIWCKHLAYVVPDEVIGSENDILIGHDFMQRYDIMLDPKARDIILDRTALLRAQMIRLVKWHI
ncbi:MAG: aspartyl protease family protein [Methanosarcinales archaeon]